MTVAEVMQAVDQMCKDKTDCEALQQLKQVADALEARIVTRQIAVSIG